MTKDDFRLFNRYLKEIGLYANFWREVRKQPERTGTIAPKEYSLKLCSHLHDLIMNLIQWDRTRLPGIWNKIYYDIQNFEDEENKNEFFENIKKIKKLQQWFFD